MNFKGHLTGGMVTGTVLTASAFVLSEASGIPAPPLLLGQIFAVALFFSLFPDLDISSIPQRWFFRGIFVILLILGYYERFEEATLLAIVAITPLLNNHRSWTHNFLSVLLFPVVIAGIYEYLLTKEKFFQSFSVDRIAQHLADHRWLVIACMGGWSTHLLLDFIQVKKMKSMQPQSSKSALLQNFHLN
jgi:membrane-bound metal-dependent hydrolase YbcI (DUF457 family)